MDGETLDVATLVYRTFVGEVPDDSVVVHIDHNMKNNSVNNLQLVPRSLNTPVSKLTSRKGILSLEGMDQYKDLSVSKLREKVVEMKKHYGLVHRNVTVCDFNTAAERHLRLMEERERKEAQRREDNEFFRQLVQRREVQKQIKAARRTRKEQIREQARAERDLMNIGMMCSNPTSKSRRRYYDFLNRAEDQTQFKRIVGEYVRRIRNSESFDVLANLTKRGITFFTNVRKKYHSLHKCQKEYNP